MRLFFHQAEAGSFVDAMGGGEHALGPQRDFAIAGGAREVDSFFYQGVAESLATWTRLHKEKPEFRGVRLVGMLDQKNVTHVLAVDFRDPAALANRIEFGDEIVDDARDQSFECAVPAELLRVAQALAMHDPADVAHAMRAQHKGGPVWRRLNQ